MSTLIGAFRTGGPFMFLLVPAGLGMLAVTLLFVSERLSGRRLPGVVWLLSPALVSLVGFAGFLLGHRQTMNAVLASPPEHQSTLIGAGSAVAMLPDQLGLALCAVALGLATLGVAAAVARDAAPLPRSAARPATALVLGMLGCLGMALIAGDAAPRVVPIMSPALLAVAAAVAVATWRTPDVSTAHLVDDAGFVTATGIGTLVVIAQLLVSLDSALMYRAISVSDPELHGVLRTGGLGAIASTVAVGIVAVLFASMMLPLALARRNAGTRRWARGFAVVALAAGVVGLRVLGSLSA